MSDPLGGLDPSTLGVSVDLIHLPMQVGLEAFKEVYMEVSGPCGYENFMRVGDGARLETAATPEKGASRVTFARDRITFQEEGAGIGSELLARRMEEVVRSLSKRVQFPVIIARTRNHRTLIRVPGDGVAADWLAEKVLQLDSESCAPLARPVRASGLRLQLPAQKNGEAMHLLRVEEWLKNPKMLFVEDNANWRQPLPVDQFSNIAAELKSAEELMVVRIPDWLSQL